VSFLGITFGSKPTVKAYYPRGKERGSDAPDKPVSEDVRIWDAAQTHRLNEKHWQGVLAQGQSINSHLMMWLETIRTRSEHEIFNNSHAEGIVFSHTVDMFGKDGPILQVQSDDEKYNKKLEAVWRKWWLKPDINEQLAGVDMLRLWWRAIWSNGEFLVQIVNMKKAESAPGRDARSKKTDDVEARLHNLDPRRLTTPIDQTKPDVMLGVKRNETGKPVAYFIAKPLDLMFQHTDPLKTDEFPPEVIIHGFIMLVANQVRGIPWLTTALPVIADLRDYDTNVLHAANLAAAQGAFLWTDHHSVQIAEADEQVIVELEPDMLQTIPPGYKVEQMNPRQPAANYVQFRKERHGDLGRGVDMPAMITRRDSSGHNYSSARFDDQGYRRGIDLNRGWLERGTLNRLVNLVARESNLANLAAGGTSAPEDVTYKWNWPAAPHVDPQKEGKGIEIRLNVGVSTMREECANLGYDYEDVIEQRGREAEMLRERGLAVPGVKVTGANQGAAKSAGSAGDNGKARQTVGATNER